MQIWWFLSVMVGVMVDVTAHPLTVYVSVLSSARLRNPQVFTQEYSATTLVREIVHDAVEQLCPEKYGSDSYAQLYVLIRPCSSRDSIRFNLMGDKNIQFYWQELESKKVYIEVLNPRRRGF